MSDTWKIKVLYLGKITGPKGIATPGLDNDVFFDAPYLSFLLKNKGRKILVDTGISEKFIIDGKAWGALPAEGGSAFLLEALKKEDTAPEEIEAVIYTHLHNDHSANCSLFKNSRVIVQRDEWLNLLNPLPVQNLKKDYDLDLVSELRGVNLIKIDGDIEYTPGIRLIKTPGHSMGSQSIAVKTEKGVVVLCGDNFLIYCNAFPHLDKMTDLQGREVKVTPAPPVYGPALPPGIVYNYFAWYESVDKIRATAEKNEPGYIIPGHEPSLLATGI